MHNGRVGRDRGNPVSGIYDLKTFTHVDTRGCSEISSHLLLIDFYFRIFSSFNSRVGFILAKGYFYHPQSPAQDNPYLYHQPSSVIHSSFVFVKAEQSL